MPRQNRSFLIGTLAMLAIASTVHGGYLDPSAFDSLGALNLTAGNYTIDTSGAPTLRDASNNILFTGTTYAQGGSFDSTVSVLDFNSINIGNGVNISASRATNPLGAAFMRTDAVISGTLKCQYRLQRRANSNAAIFGGTGDGREWAGGAGGGKGGDGVGAWVRTGTGPGGGPGGVGGIGLVQAGGGSFGGKGGANAAGASGATYGNLNLLLQGGSGGGATGVSAFESIGGGGGGGGGAIELGDVGLDHLLRSRKPAGQRGGNSGSGFAANAGAGSGGGLLIHGSHHRPRVQQLDPRPRRRRIRWRGSHPLPDRHGDHREPWRHRQRRGRGRDRQSAKRHRRVRLPQCCRRRPRAIFDHAGRPRRAWRVPAGSRSTPGLVTLTMKIAVLRSAGSPERGFASMLVTSFAAGTHPSPDQLADFGRGEIDDSLAEAIEGHLADCAECLRWLESGRPDDSWLALLRVVGSSALAGSSNRRQASTAGRNSARPSGYELEALIGRGGMGVVHRGSACSLRPPDRRAWPCRR